MKDAQQCQQSVRLAQKNGLHLRPVSAIVKTAAEFECDIQITWDQKSASAKSAMELLTLGATMGAELQITAQGIDAIEAIAAITEILQREQ